jgi:hypothetical protein
LLKRLIAQEVKLTEALAIADEAKLKRAVVLGLLRKLGNMNEEQDLAARFRAIRRRLEQAPVNRRSAATFAELTLAMHELNLKLSEEFYPCG